MFDTIRVWNTQAARPNRPTRDVDVLVIHVLERLNFRVSDQVVSRKLLFVLIKNYQNNLCFRKVLTKNCWRSFYGFLLIIISFVGQQRVQIIKKARDDRKWPLSRTCHCDFMDRKVFVQVPPDTKYRFFHLYICKPGKFTRNGSFRRILNRKHFSVLSSASTVKNGLFKLLLVNIKASLGSYLTGKRDLVTIL